MDYKLVGSCVLLSQEACKSLGYALNEYYVSYPILVYSKDESLDEGILFFEYQYKHQETGAYKTKMRYIPSHLINNLYNIKTSKEIYPELFL